MGGQSEREIMSFTRIYTKDKLAVKPIEFSKHFVTIHHAILQIFLGRMTSFEEYINSLKEEAERGSNPNSGIALDKFIKVADNIVCRVVDITPTPSMVFVHRLHLKHRFEKGTI